MENTGVTYWLGTKVEVIPPPRNQTIMVVSAHPDDIESECAGTLVLAKENNCIINILIGTSGGDLKREKEATAAGIILGVDEIKFLRFPDGEVENTKSLRKEIVRYIRLWKPDIVMTYDSDFSLPLYVSHPDHRAVGRATLDAVFPHARNIHSFPKQIQVGLGPHKVGSVWLFGSANATKYIDIQHSLEKKVQARLVHQSQVSKVEKIQNAWHKMAHDTGKRANLEYAEAFTIVAVE